MNHAKGQRIAALSPLLLGIIVAVFGCRWAHPLAVVSQPTSTIVLAGQTATFAVKTTGAITLRYQWQKNGEDIQGANSSIYITPPTTVVDDGAKFRVVIRNGDRVVVSNEVALGVNLSARNYATNFASRENPLSENGNWIEGQNAGGDLWGNVQTDGTMAFGTSEPTEFGDPTAVLAGRWSATQTAAATAKVNSTPVGPCCHEVEVRLRTIVSSRNITGYEAYCSVMPNKPYCHIARWNGPNGSYCNIEGVSPDTYLVTGDTLSATVTGTNPVVITAYKNGMQIMQAVDSGASCDTGGAAGPFTSGSPGIGFYSNKDNNWALFGLFNFTASDGVSPQEVSSEATKPTSNPGSAAFKK